MITIYTDRFLPDHMAGRVLFGIALIRPAYRHDIGLHEHERVHVHQALRGLIIFHGLLYRFSKAYRFKCEVEAYREQLRHAPATTDSRGINHFVDLFAGYIANDYDLDVTVERARTALLTPEMP